MSIDTIDAVLDVVAVIAGLKSHGIAALYFLEVLVAEADKAQKVTAVTAE